VKFIKTIAFVLLCSLAPGGSSKILSATNAHIQRLISIQNSTIYEVNLRQYTPEGTFKAFTAQLPKLKELGVDILWFMPIHPIGKKNRKGTLGSYYSVQDYLAVNPEFGTLEDFKSLVRKAHDIGMYVLMDWVANHTAWDNPLAQQHPDWYTKDANGHFFPRVKDWTDVIDLDYRNPDLRNYMIEALKFWVNETDIDGYRCDVAGMVPLHFWQNVRRALDVIKPVFMLAEWETPTLHNEAFDMTYSWKLYRAFNAIAKGKKQGSVIDDLLQKEKKEYPPTALRMRFTTNHDENSWNGTVFERLGDGVEVFAVLTFTLPGMPLIYSGQEAGLNKRLAFFEKDVIPWREHPFFALYQKLISLKKENPALWHGQNGGAYSPVITSEANSVFAFIRSTIKQKILVVTNLSNATRTFQLKGTDYAGDYTDMFTGEKSIISAETRLTLQPWDYKLYRN